VFILKGLFSAYFVRNEPGSGKKTGSPKRVENTRIPHLTFDHDDARVYTPAMQERIYRGDAGYVPVSSRWSGTSSYASVVYDRALTRASRCFMRG